MLSKEEIIKGNTEIKSKVLIFEQKEDTYPFLYINFDYEVKIKSISIYPGNISWTRLKNISVQVSQDGITWEYINSICFLFKRKVIVHFRQYYLAKKCRIVFSDNKIYYNAKVKVKILGKKLLFLSSRFDGIGIRLLNLLNVMYFAKLTGNRFGFVWYPINGLEFDGYKISDEKNFFSPTFIKKYSYTKLLPRSICQQEQAGIILNQYISSNKLPLEKYSFKDFSLLPSQYIWGNYFFQMRLFNYFTSITKKKNYTALSNLWKEIDFSDEIKIINNYVNKLYRKYNGYDAIHIRLGDIVYKSFRNRYVFTDKASMIELFLAFLLLNLPKGKNFIIFTDSVDKVKELILQLYTYKQINYNDEIWGNIIFSVDLFQSVDCLGFEDIALKFFDIFLMAKVKKIYAPSLSAFSELSMVIANSELIPISGIFRNDYYNVICNIRKLFFLDKEMLSFSALWCYRHRNFFKIKKEQWINLLHQGFLGMDNIITKYLMHIELYLYLKDYDFCNEYLYRIESELSLKKIIDFAKIDFKNEVELKNASHLFEYILKSIKSHQKDTLNYPYIQKLCSYL